jgi:hypothetical protein
MKQMAQKKKSAPPSSKTLPKPSTGIQGLDEITGGGLPRSRPTLVSGSAGSGKTLFGLEFLVRGATQFNEPGVFMSFEESIPDLTKNVASLGFDLDRLVAEKKLFVDHVSITRSEIGETGEYDPKAFSFELPTRSIGWGRGESCWTPLKRYSVNCQTQVSFAPRSVACSTGSRKKD